MPVLAEAVVVLLTCNGRVWLARRSPNSSTMGGLLECPGGKVGPAEGLLMAAQREVEEETGRHITYDRFVQVGRLNIGTLMVHLFTVEVGTLEFPKDTEPGKRGAWQLSEPGGVKLRTLTPSSAALIAVMLEHARLNHAKAT